MTTMPIIVVGGLDVGGEDGQSRGIHCARVPTLEQVPEISAKLQEVYDSTRRSQDRMLTFLETISGPQAELRPSENRWSIGELITSS